MLHLFQKYTEIGSFAIEKLHDVLEEMHAVCVVGIKNIGKKTLIKQISKKHYDCMHFLNISEPKFQQVIEQIYNKNFVVKRKTLLYFQYKKQFHVQILNTLKFAGPDLHIIIYGEPAIQLLMNSHCFCFKMKPPSLQQKMNELTEISWKEYSHDRNVAEIASKFHTYHDCLIALEMYENNIYTIYSYSQNVENIVKNFILNDGLTLIQLRTILYNLIMHLQCFSDIIWCFINTIIQHTPLNLATLSDILNIGSQCDHTYAISNKEIYHYEYFVMKVKEIITSSRKRILNDQQQNLQ